MPAMDTTLIRTPDQRLRIFVSSTLKELQEERNAAREAIRGLRLTPVLFEQGARPYPPRNLYRAYLEQSHVFVGIYWQQYGWIAPDMDVSGLEDEYRLAAERPRLIYIREPAPNREPRLTQLLDQIKRDGLASYKSFRSAPELRALLEDDLAVLLSERFEGSRTGSTTTVRVDGRRVTALPAPASRFIGRDREVRAVRELLEQEDARLVTITGLGGIGKSRLALRVAAEMENNFRDGAAVVMLGAVSTPAMVALAIQQTLGLEDRSGRAPVDVLRDFLRDREQLLVLDSFEHVVAAAPIVSELLEASPRLKILVTSREVLRISGERTFDVPPLSLPESGQLSAETLGRSDAVQLFADRAKAAQESFRLDDTTAPIVAEISRRLEGLPLAIELAAARVRMLPLPAILRKLESRLGLLTGGPRDLPERQQTMRATIDWSYDLLDERDKALFARLGVFVGGWTLDSVETVCASEADVDAFEAVSSLIDKSLVRQEGFAGDEPRFSMLETVREYALERLREREEVDLRRDLHASYFLTLAEKGAPERMTAPQEQLVDRFAAESGNLRAAMRWLLDQKAGGRAARMGWALWNCWWLRSHLTEAVSWMNEVLATSETLTLEERAKATVVLGTSEVGLGDYEQGKRELRKAYDLYEELGDHHGMAGALAALGFAVSMTDGSQGEDLVRQAVAMYRKLQDPWALSFAIFGLGRVLVIEGRSEEAIPLLEESVAWARGAGEKTMLAIALSTVGRARLGVGDLRGAKAASVESLQLAGSLGDRGVSAWALEGLAAVAVAAGDPSTGALLFGAAEGTRKSLGRATWVTEQQAYERTERELRAALGDAPFEATFGEGMKMALPDVRTLAAALLSGS